MTSTDVRANMGNMQYEPLTDMRIVASGGSKRAEIPQDIEEELLASVRRLREELRTGAGERHFSQDEKGLIGYIGPLNKVRGLNLDELRKEFAGTMSEEDQSRFSTMRIGEAFLFGDGPEGPEKGRILRGLVMKYDSSLPPGNLKDVADMSERFGQWLETRVKGKGAA